MTATSYATRTSRINLLTPEYDDGEYTCNVLDTLVWQKTEGGLSFKDLECGGVAQPSADSVIEIQYTATLVSTGELIEKTSASRPLTLALGSGSMDMFEEAVRGMAVGGRRRLNLPPSSKWAVYDDETIQFEIELVGTKTGFDAALFQIGGLRSIFRTALLLSFIPDLLKLVGVLPPDGAPPLAQAGGDAVAAAAHHLVVTDAANQWAANGLNSLF
jgi:hypothetical protein